MYVGEGNNLCSYTVNFVPNQLLVMLKIKSIGLLRFGTVVTQAKTNTDSS